MANDIDIRVIRLLFDTSRQWVSTCLLLLLGALLATVPAQAMNQAAPVVRICFNYDCNRSAHVRLSPDEWQVVVNQFKPAAGSAAEERDMIRRAIAVLEHIAGTQTPTHRDRGRNAFSDGSGQMDCVDESTNTTSYLGLLEMYGLLQWHSVAGRVYRAPYITDLHWAGQIIEDATRQHYAVDSWYLNNGEMPYIQSLNDWLRKEPVE